MNQPPGTSTMDWGVGEYEPTGRRLLPAAHVLTTAAELREGERVVDLGCGTGNVALLAAAAGAQVTAIDPSPRLLEVTGQAARGAGLTVTCALGNAASLPVPAASVDCLLSNFGIIFAPDASAAAAEVARVVSPHGRVLFTAWVGGGARAKAMATAQELVRAALGAPPAKPDFRWHDELAVRELFGDHDFAVDVVGRHEVVITDTSPAAHLEDDISHHPLAVAGFAVLRQHGLADLARERLLEVLVEGNEDPAAFRSTSSYVVVSGRSRRAR